MRLLDLYKAHAPLIKQKATREIKISDKAMATLNLLHVERKCCVNQASRKPTSAVAKIAMKMEWFVMGHKLK